MNFMHNGVPCKNLEAEWNNPDEKEIETENKNLGESLKKLLGMPNIASKETTVRGYDHEVQGGTVAKPFVGKENDGPADAAIVRPLLDDWKGTVISNGINPDYSDKDAYWMACSVIDEALRNAICVGADFEKIAILDNFSWGSPEKPKVLGELIRACKGCYDASKGFDVPFISGKDSLYNEYSTGNKTITIPGTLLISAVGIIEDSRKKVSMPFKKEGNPIYIIGETYPELGAGHYAKLMNSTDGKVPEVRFEKARKTFSKLSKLMASQNEEKIVLACHDCSEGGIGVAVAEMCFASEKGAELFLKKVPLGKEIVQEDFVLFSESNSRFIVEVDTGKKKEFEQAMNGTTFAEIGNICGKSLVVNGLKGNKVLQEGIDDLKRAWKKTLGW